MNIYLKLTIKKYHVVSSYTTVLVWFALFLRLSAKWCSVGVEHAICSVLARSACPMSTKVKYNKYVWDLRKRHDHFQRRVHKCITVCACNRLKGLQSVALLTEANRERLAGQLHTFGVRGVKKQTASSVLARGDHSEKNFQLSCVQPWAPHYNNKMHSLQICTEFILKTFNLSLSVLQLQNLLRFIVDN